MRHPKLILFSRWFVGLLFIFSGLIKANDPTGFGYKLQEYFEVFGLHFLNPAATWIAIFICTAEIALGAALLFRLRLQWVIPGLLGMIIFFTFLTFYSAVGEVVTSCGCFGDAIPLTPWQSFFKDLVLLFFILVLYLNRQRMPSANLSLKNQNLYFAAFAVLAFCFSLFTLAYLPILDFLPYKKGNHLPSLMKAPAGAAPDVYEVVYELEHQKTGQQKQVNDKEYIASGIWKDKNWKIKGQPKSRLVSKGYEVKIRDLKILDGQAVDYTAEILEHPFYHLVVVAYDLHSADKQALGMLNALAINAAENHGTRTVILTSSSVGTAEKLRKQLRLVPDIFYADAVPLKSMVRANPGVLLLKNGEVMGKWSYRNVPEYEELAKAYFLKND